MDGNLLRFSLDTTYAFIDCETFNLCLHFCHNRPWQISLLEVTGETITNSLDLHINWPDAPHLKIGREAAIITKFNEIEHNQKAILPEAAFKQFWPILKKVDRIIMHNGLRFDLYLLKAYAEMMGEDWRFMMPKIIDTKSIAQGIKMNILYKPNEGSFLEYQYRMANIVARGIKTRLSLLASEYGIKIDENQLHNAAYDLEINKMVWDKMKFQIEL